MKDSCLHCKKSTSFKIVQNTHDYQIISCRFCGTKHILSKSLYLDIPLSLLKDVESVFEEDDTDFEEKKSTPGNLLKAIICIFLTLLFVSSLIFVCTNLIIQQLFQ